MRISLKHLLVFCSLMFLSVFITSGQQRDTLNYIQLDYSFPATYEIEKITIKGAEHYDKSVLLILSGLYIGQSVKIPGDEITKAVTNLWKQKLFEDVKISVIGSKDNKVHLQIFLLEKPRIACFTIKGLSKGKARDLYEELSGLKTGMIITDNLMNTTENRIVKYFGQKGYLNTAVSITHVRSDYAKNLDTLKIFVDRGRKIKINKIIINGNTQLSDKKIWKQFKETKPKSKLLGKSKFIEDDFNDDKQKIIEKYLSLGYRDIAILSDSVYRHDEKSIDVVININEGHKYYFRNIEWVGNTKHSTALLNNILKIKKGDVYDQSVLESKLQMNQNGLDVSTLYMDDGYLFFNISPVEVLVENDSIDLEIRMYEGPQAIINKVTVKGNTKTSDHVILREVRTRPGQKFSRSDITRTLRELSQLGYFDPEQLGVNPIPNQATGTVDIEYKVEERPNDQIELSGGFGNNMVIGTLGLSLNNFAARKVFKRGGWDPVPSGDGQRMAIRAQSSGAYYQSYSLSFSEPWLGGKKPNSFSVSVSRSISKRSVADPEIALRTNSIVVGLGKRIKWPDDFFTLQYVGSYLRYFHVGDSTHLFQDGIPLGVSHNFNFKFIFGRNSVDGPIFPRGGSNISFTMQLSPPYSLLRNKSYEELKPEQRTKFVEYHKWKFDSQWFTRLDAKGNLVLMTRANFGFMGYYTKDYGITGYERFWLGGSGLMGWSIDGREMISLRGYADYSLKPYSTELRQTVGGTIYNRYTMELRYLISPNPSATVYAHVFSEAGRSWLKFKDFNPFEVYRSAGFGVRLFLPMFGLIGLDWGYGFDTVDLPRDGSYAQPGKGNFHFMLGQTF